MYKLYKRCRKCGEWSLVNMISLLQC